MQNDTYKIGQVAARLGVHVNTVRLWTAEFADYMEAGALAPKGSVRRYSARDLAILQRVRELRTEQPPRAIAEIKTIIAAMAPADRHAVAAEHAIQPPTATPQGAELALIVSEAMRAELEAYRAIVEAGAGRVSRARWEGFSMGFTAAVLVILAALGLFALLAAWLGG